VRKIKIKIEMLFWAFLTYPKRILDFRWFLAYLEYPKNELKRLGKPGCRSRKPGVNSRKGGHIH
jgi:hypothetical protein